MCNLPRAAKVYHSREQPKAYAEGGEKLAGWERKQSTRQLFQSAILWETVRTGTPPSALLGIGDGRSRGWNVND